MKVATDNDELAELLWEARSGDDAAFASLYRRFAPMARSTALHIVSDPHAADDLTHEAFYLVLRALRSGHGPTHSFARYLQSTIRRLAYRYVAGSKGTVITGDAEEWERYLLPLPSSTAQNDLVSAAWASLPARWRRVLWLIEVERYTPAELAVPMSMTPTAVSSLAVRARRGLHIAYLAMQRKEVRLASAHA